MYRTEEVDAVASVTALRMETGELMEAAQDDVRFIGIQRNNQPVAVLMSWEVYKALRPVLDDL